MQHRHMTFPQRKITKSYRSVTGHFPSVKNNRSVAFDSLLERKLFLTLEFDDAVEGYMEQPQIKIKDNGKPSMYNLDCHIMYSAASGKNDAIVEAKYVDELRRDKEKLDRKFRRVESTVKTMNIDFALYTEETTSSTLIDNLDFLYRYKTQRLSDENNPKILNSIENPISAFDLANSLAKNKTEYFQLSNAIWALVAEGKLQADLNHEVLTMNTLVWRNDERH